MKVGDTVRRGWSTWAEAGSITPARWAKGAGRRPSWQAFEHRIPVEGLITGVIGRRRGAGGRRPRLLSAGQLDIRFVEDPAVFVGGATSSASASSRPGAAGSRTRSRRAARSRSRRPRRAIELRKTLESARWSRAPSPPSRTTAPWSTSAASRGCTPELGFRVRHPSGAERGPHGRGAGHQDGVTDDQTPSGSLSLKALERDPGRTRRALSDRRVRGKVTRMQPFGASSRWRPGSKGWCTSQLRRRAHQPPARGRAGKEVT